MTTAQAKNRAITGLITIGYVIDQRIKRTHFQRTCLQNVQAQGDKALDTLVTLAASMGHQLQEIDAVISSQWKGISPHIEQLVPHDLQTAFCLRNVYKRMQNLLDFKNKIEDRPPYTNDVEVLNLQDFTASLELQVKILEIFGEQNDSDLQGSTELIKMEENHNHLKSLEKLSDDVTKRAVERTDWQANSPAQALLRKSMYSSWQRLHVMYRSLELRIDSADSHQAIEIHY